MKVTSLTRLSSCDKGGVIGRRKGMALKEREREWRVESRW